MTTTNNVFGVTPQGFKTMRLIDAKNMLENNFIGEFGDVNLEPQSVIGQIIGIFAKIIADEWENLADVYTSGYPSSASGISLDNVVELNGITRLPAQRTSVTGAATGVEGTIIPANSLARTPANGQVFFSTGSSIITRSNSIQDVIEVVNLASQAYTVVINTTSYIYSLPVLGFTGSFVSGNVINMRLNGLSLPVVNFITDSNTTLIAIRDNILAQTSVIQSATIVANTIQIVPVTGKQTAFTDVRITGGATQPTYSLSFIQPVSLDSIASNLASIISTSPNITGAYTTGKTFTITADDGFTPFSLNLGAGLQLISITSPISFLSQNYGPIPAPAGSLTDIITPVAGWISLTNLIAGSTGRNVETDTELRLRRSNSLRVLGNATVEAIRARILQQVPNVTAVTVYENVTMTQEPIILNFSVPLTTGSNVHVTLDGINLPIVTFITDNLTTMNLVAQLLANQDQIQTATVSGSSNNLITITMSEAEEVVINVDVTDGVNPVTVTETGGRPPKSFEAIVQGGSDQDVALKIWQVKPAGIETFGNVNNGNGIVIVDSQGHNQTIHFTRATSAYIFVNVIITLNPQETFPANGIQLITNAILAYGNSLGIGVDVFLQRVQAQVFSIPGVASAVVTLARTSSLSDTPSYAATDIYIADTEVSSWSIGQIYVGF